MDAKRGRKQRRTAAPADLSRIAGRGEGAAIFLDDKSPNRPNQRYSCERYMAKHLTRVPRADRIRRAVDRVFHDGWTVSQAWRYYGISSITLNKHLKARRAAQAEVDGRSDGARAERVMVDTPHGPRVANDVDDEGNPVHTPFEFLDERRRVPDICTFVRRYFSGVECPDCRVHHEVPFYQDEMLRQMVDPKIRRLLVNLPPYHSKSTTGTVYSTLYELARDPNSRHAIISRSSFMAERFMRQIGEFLLNRDRYERSEGNLIDDWGPFNEGVQTWNRQQIYITGRSSTEKDPSISAYGQGTQIYGSRFERIICDDIADLENQRNPERVADMRDKIVQEYQSRVGRTGKVIVIGTRVTPADVYSHLLELPGYHILRYPCILDEFNKATLWPEHFSYEDAVAVRDQMSFDQFELVYQQSDIPTIGASFTPEHVEKARDQDRCLGHVPPGSLLVAGLDPGGANAQAGFTAMVLWAVELSTGKRYLVDLVNQKQMKAPQMKAQIIDWCQRYPIREFRVETNGLQAQLTEYDTQLRMALSELGVRITPHITHGNRGGKWDPVHGVEAMSVLWHNGQVSVPYGDIVSRRRVQPLEEQLLRVPMNLQDKSSPSDLVMAAWFAELGCADLMRREALPKFSPRARVPARLMMRRRLVSLTGGARLPSVEEQGLMVPSNRRLVNVGVSKPWR